MLAVALATIVLGIIIAIYDGGTPFHIFLGGTSFGVGLVLGLIAIVNYRAMRRRERWWKGK